MCDNTKIVWKKSRLTKVSIAIIIGNLDEQMFHILNKKLHKCEKVMWKVSVALVDIKHKLNQKQQIFLNGLNRMKQNVSNWMQLVI